MRIRTQDCDTIFLILNYLIKYLSGWWVGGYLLLFSVFQPPTALRVSSGSCDSDADFHILFLPPSYLLFNFQTFYIHLYFSCIFFVHLFLSHVMLFFKFCLFIHLFIFCVFINKSCCRIVRNMFLFLFI